MIQITKWLHKLHWCNMLTHIVQNIKSTLFSIIPLCNVDLARICLFIYQPWLYLKMWFYPYSHKNYKTKMQRCVLRLNLHQPITLTLQNYNISFWNNNCFFYVADMLGYLNFSAVPNGTENINQYLLPCTRICLRHILLENSGSLIIKLSYIHS